MSRKNLFIRLPLPFCLVLLYFSFILVLDLNADSSQSRANQFFISNHQNDTKLFLSTILEKRIQKKASIFILHQLSFSSSIGFEELRIEGHWEEKLGYPKNSFVLHPVSCKVFRNKTGEKRWVLTRTMDCDHNTWFFEENATSTLYAESLQSEPLQFTQEESKGNYPPGVVIQYNPSGFPILWSTSARKVWKNAQALNSENKVLGKISNGNDSFLILDLSVDSEKPRINEVLFFKNPERKSMWD
ncbi:MAG: hypothetical protein H7A24_03195 [Leptospiraceae bacterium]|nr:hypothetical protein [Leptospiraceae bacterium]MCP5510855.1 hypothetical protein [Leptospiraceae bacterium]